MGSGEGALPLPEIFFDFESEITTFSAFWALAHVARGHGPPRPLDPPVNIIQYNNTIQYKVLLPSHIQVSKSNRLYVIICQRNKIMKCKTSFAKIGRLTHVGINNS